MKRRPLLPAHSRFSMPSNAAPLPLWDIKFGHNQGTGFFPVPFFGSLHDRLRRTWKGVHAESVRVRASRESQIENLCLPCPQIRRIQTPKKVAIDVRNAAEMLGKKPKGISQQSPGLRGTSYPG